jgi:hypothetical protein
MARKIINGAEFTLHIVASEGGVIIVKVFKRGDKDLIECSIFTEQGEALTDYISQFTTKTESITQFLNTI